MIRVWKEGRLTEVFQYEDSEEVEEEDAGGEVQASEEKLKSDTRELFEERVDETDSKRYKRKFSSLCCAVM